MGCHSQHDLTIIRGDTLELFVGLARGWENIADEPAAYEGRLVIREAQDDAYPELRVITSAPIPATDNRFPGMDFLLDLSMSPQETGSLPDYPVVCFCELRRLDGTYVRRLFEGRVRQRD